MIWILVSALPAATALVLHFFDVLAAVGFYHAVCLAGLLLGWRGNLRRPPGTWRWTSISCALILGGLAVGWFLPRPGDVGALLREKLFAGSETRFWIFAAYSMVVHCPLEELFWRGVVDPRSRAANAAGFYLMHAVPLAVFLGSPWQGAMLALPAGAAGIWWSWLARRSGTLWPSLLSHAAADAAILGMARVLAFGPPA